MVLLLRKLNLYFTKDTEAVHYFPGGGGGVQMLISIETHIHTGVRTPYPPLYPRMGNVVITGQYVSQSGF